MTAEIINGREIAAEIKSEVRERIKWLMKKYEVTPRVTTLKIGENPSSDLYLKLRDKACEGVGVVTSTIELPGDVSEDQVFQTVKKLNEDVSVHGVFIQLPLPRHINPRGVFNLLDPCKDAEGLTPFNTGGIFLGVENIVPCTPLAVLKILEHEKTVLKGKNVVVVNHSRVVGRPLCGLFLNRDATVCVCHVHTRDLKEHSVKADVLVTATGIPGLIKKEHVKEKSFVIDVGIVKNRGGVSGDVDFENVKEKVGKITPVPGGVGPVTVACSLLNIVKTYENCCVKKKI